MNLCVVNQWYTSPNESWRLHAKLKWLLSSPQELAHRNEYEWHIQEENLRNLVLHNFF